MHALSRSDWAKTLLLPAHCYFSWNEGSFFPEVFSGCKSTLVCVRKWLCWTWIRKRVQLLLNTCSKSTQVLKWTRKRTHPQTQAETRQCGRETLYLSSLSLSFLLFFISVILVSNAVDKKTLKNDICIVKVLTMRDRLHGCRIKWNI